jgi:hypothetical protein
MTIQVREEAPTPKKPNRRLPPRGDDEDDILR